MDIEDLATVCDGSLEIGKGREAQMICHRSHGSPPRLMAPELIRGPDSRESYATPSAGNGITSRRRITMRKKRHKPDEIVAKLRQVDVLVAQGTPVADAIRAIGVTEVSGD